MDFDGAIKYDTFKPDGTPRKLLDISRIRALGWRPKISLKSGLKNSYGWYVKAAGQPDGKAAGRRGEKTKV